MKSFLKNWGGITIRRGITFCLTRFHLRASLLGYGDNGGDNI